MVKKITTSSFDEKLRGVMKRKGYEITRMLVMVRSIKQQEI